MQLTTSSTTEAAVRSLPACDDCRLPVSFRAEVADLAHGRQVRVYQCANCAKVFWEDDAPA